MFAQGFCHVHQGGLKLQLNLRTQEWYSMFCFWPFDASVLILITSGREGEGGFIEIGVYYKLWHPKGCDKRVAKDKLIAPGQSQLLQMSC